MDTKKLMEEISELLEENARLHQYKRDVDEGIRAAKDTLRQEHCDLCGKDAKKCHCHGYRNTHKKLVAE